MKILHVCSHFYPCIGGIEAYVEGLCSKLMNEGHISDVLCLDRCASGTTMLPESDMLNGSKIIRIPFLNAKYYKIAPSVLKYIGDYDVIHVHGLGFFMDFLAATKLLHKKPLILSTHGGIFHTKNLYRLKKLYFSTAGRFAANSTRCVIAHSKNDFELFSKISEPVLVPYSIDVKELTQGSKNQEKSILFVGRLAKNKNVSRLIEVFSLVKKRLPYAKLYIVGDGPEMKALKDLSEKLSLSDSVTFTGEKRGKDLNEFYWKCKVFASASLYEGFGISTIEAMAAGCIPVVNDIEAFRNFIKSGENGVLCNFSNVYEAADVILSALNENKIKVSKIINSVWEYDWKINMDKILKIYNNCIS